MLSLFKENKIARFLLIAVTLYVVWLLLYYFLIHPYTTWDFHLNYNIAWLGEKCFALFGMESDIVIESDHVVLYLNSGNLRGIWVGDECNGFKLFSIFSIFIIAFPGNRKSKFWFIPLGLVIIHLANVIRVVSLVLINNHYPRYLDFNHLYTFTVFVYAIIFLLWYIWAKKYAGHEHKA